MSRRARSLDVLLAEINRLAPNRAKVSDGWLGDRAHAARASRHNPNNAGVVCAQDITHDPSGGCDIHSIARRLVKDPHPDLEYVISDGAVAKRSNGWKWVRYSGSNPHTKHAHFAVGRGPDSEPTQPYDTTTPWGVAPEPEDDMASSDEILSELQVIRRFVEDDRKAGIFTEQRIIDLTALVKAKEDPAEFAAQIAKHLEGVTSEQVEQAVRNVLVEGVG